MSGRPKSEPKAAPNGGLWIRVVANLSTRNVTWKMVEGCLAGLPIPPGVPRSIYQKAAMGYLVAFWGNIAEHSTDGVVVHLPDRQLEQWAEWDGETGIFARWFRDKHLDPETGKCREWDDMQGALEKRREADAVRQRRKRELDRVANGAIDEIDLGGGPRAAASMERTERPVVDAAFMAQKLCIAANRGMNDNPAIGAAYNPIIATRGDSLETVEAFVSAGLTDWKLVTSILYTIAKQYKPQKNGDHIRTLVFFRERTITVYNRHMAKLAATSGDSPAEVSVDTKPTAQSKAARSGAGALAAARSVGLADD